MNAQSLSPTSLSFYQEMIREVTGAPVGVLAILENIMRDEVFHSTLDWQSREEFAEGARQAYAIYLDDMVFYLRKARAHSLRWRINQLENDLVRARKRGNPKMIERLETQLGLAARNLEAIGSLVARDV